MYISLEKYVSLEDLFWKTDSWPVVRSCLEALLSCVLSRGVVSIH